MAHPARRSAPVNIREQRRTFFISSRTSQGRAILQTEQMANLFLDVLRRYVAAHRFRIHDFVVMRNHFHLLLSVDGDMAVEKGSAIDQGQLLLSCQEGAGLSTRDLAARLFRDTGL